MSNEWDESLRNSALLVWDVQYGIAGRAFNLKDMLGKISSIKEQMHSLGRPVIYTQTTSIPFEYQSKYTKYRTRRRGMDPKIVKFNLEGSDEWQIIKEVSPDSEDIVLKKYTPSLFVGTNAEQLLHNVGVDSLIITGVSTEIGVETTARHASCLGFIPIIVQDAVGSGDENMHKAALAEMQTMFEVRTADSIIRTMKGI